ncbi:MAG: cytochrome c, partial [Planctomycetales bacterium]|nr:cytochrome c [Planctomycetales bacterium]
MSLFWINGILSWQLTPGGWLASGSVWQGFFNPSFWPSLLFRTLTSMATAALVATLVVNLSPRFNHDERRTLIRAAFWFLAPMVLMPPLGVWFMAVLPASARQWATGGSIAMTLFLSISVGASALIGGYAAAVLLRKGLTINGATAAMLVALGFGATAGAEFVREGVRKPYTVRGALYSNSITQPEVERLRREGCVASDPYPLRNAQETPNDQLRTGAAVFRIQCSVCHTIDGANGLLHLTDGWTDRQLHLNIAQLQRTKPFMPPFAGASEEVLALAEWIKWNEAGRPKQWKERQDEQALQAIQEYLDEAGTAPGVEVPGDQ